MHLIMSGSCQTLTQQSSSIINISDTLNSQVLNIFHKLAKSVDSFALIYTNGLLTQAYHVSSGKK